MLASTVKIWLANTHKPIVLRRERLNALSADIAGSAIVDFWAVGTAAVREACRVGVTGQAVGVGTIYTTSSHRDCLQRCRRWTYGGPSTDVVVVQSGYINPAVGNTLCT